MKGKLTNSDDNFFEAKPISDSAVSIDIEKVKSLDQASIVALKKVISDENLNLEVKLISSIKDLDCLVEINKFYIQIVITGISSDEAIIPLKRWYKKNSAPQLILAMSIDEENGLIEFPGLITEKEFKNLIKEPNPKNKYVNIPINSFKGGINRFLSMIQILDLEALSREGLRGSKIRINLLDNLIFHRKKLSLGLLILAGIFATPSLFKPRLLYNLASISANKLEPIYTRSSSEENNIKICLLSPNSSFDGTKNIVNLSFDKPLIFPKTKVEKIIISKNGEIIWSREINSNKKSYKPIQWPIKPVEPNEEYLISFAQNGISSEEYLDITLKASPQKSFKKLSNEIKKIGSSKSAWIKNINNKLKKEQDMALALLFSEKAPDSKIIEKAKSTVINNNKCL
ncbi:MAG: hypothetical protein JJ848_004995 [Prochlorococcus marinus CUG1439]|uniref:hypothetical protein n=1 Tax=Prochlorococcus sp. MIT 1314 TaxID=3096220 RepID=UPI001B102AE8|nr:hypothetical protein [Prochlorococcus sp. MIT 1314]MCR8539690.1 hypothetical protein [Prochlorococcus marinus CUG1439]